MEQQYRIINQSMPYFPLAVTGSMGCGKSFTCQTLNRVAVRKGICVSVIDVDTLRARILEDKSGDYLSLHAELVNYFSSRILSKGGGIDRMRLAEALFSSEQSMSYFDRLFDPILTGQILKVLSKKRGIVLIDWALIVEKNLLMLTDYNAILVECTLSTQRTRLSGGDLPESQVQARIALQHRNEEKKRRIFKAQRKAGYGYFLTIQTDENPSEHAYEKLLEKIIGVLKGDEVWRSLS